MKVRIHGQYFGVTGYAAHTRGLTRGLHDNGVDVRVSSQLPEQWGRYCNDEEVKWLSTAPDKDETVIVIGLPPVWRYALSDRPKRFIGCLIWEGSKIPEYWLEYLLDERVEQVWVPSRHVRDAIDLAASCSVLSTEELSVLTAKVHVVPHGVDLGVFRPMKKDSKRPFTFIANKGWVDAVNDRGGLQYALKAFHEEFGVDEDVRFVVKINPAYVQVSNVENWVKGMLEKIGIVEKKAPILVTMNEFPEEQMPLFYRDGDVFVCTTRCEGFNIPGLEAHACGLPTIQTAYGGQLDYMNEDTDYYVDYLLCGVSHDVLYEEADWAVPDIMSIRNHMRHCFNNRQEVREYGQRAAESSSGWSWFYTGTLAKKLLG